MLLPALIGLHFRVLVRGRVEGDLIVLCVRMLEGFLFSWLLIVAAVVGSLEGRAWIIVGEVHARSDFEGFLIGPLRRWEVIVFLIRVVIVMGSNGLIVVLLGQVFDLRLSVNGELFLDVKLEFFLEGNWTNIHFFFHIHCPLLFLDVYCPDTDRINFILSLYFIVDKLFFAFSCLNV